MTDATRHFTPEEIALNELDLAERARLCDPIRLQHDLAALRRITAANAARRANQRAIHSLQLAMDYRAAHLKRVKLDADMLANVRAVLYLKVELAA